MGGTYVPNRITDWQQLKHKPQTMNYMLLQTINEPGGVIPRGTISELKMTASREHEIQRRVRNGLEPPPDNDDQWYCTFDSEDGKFHFTFTKKYMIERPSWFMVGATVAPMRPLEGESLITRQL